MKNTIVLCGIDFVGKNLVSQVIENAIEKDRGITISTFEPEPMIITAPRLDWKELILHDKKGKLFELPKSKYHK